MSVRLDSLDKKIIEYLSRDFPVSARPFRALGTRFKLSEDRIFRRVKFFQKNRIFRKIGPRLDLKKIGIKSTLFALKVPKNKIESVSGFLAMKNSVTHNYIRDNEFNIWFTYSYRHKREKDDLINQIRKGFNISCVLDFVTQRKIKLGFQLPL